MFPFSSVGAAGDREDGADASGVEDNYLYSFTSVGSAFLS